jgi:hypothetical protein
MEVINSFFTNIKDKLTNPFFGTLILVLFIHHWKLWYTFLNFDSDSTLQNKIAIIQTYIDDNFDFSSFMFDVLQAIIFMFVGYIIILGTRSLVIWIEFGLMPIITGRIINKNVVRRSEYDEVVKERESYFDQYEEQRKSLREFSKTIDEQTEQLKLKDQSLLGQSDKITKTVKELDFNKKKLENLIANNNKTIHELELNKQSFNVLKSENEIKIKYIEFFSNIFFSPVSKLFFTSADKFSPPIIDKVKELKNENKWSTFLRVADFIYNGGSIGGEELTEMIEKEIAFNRETREDLTPIGKIIWVYRDVFENYKE